MTSSDLKRWPFEAGSGWRPNACVIGVSRWKDFLPGFMPEYRVRRFSKNLSWFKFALLVLPRIKMSRKTQVCVWGFKEPDYLTETLEKMGRNLTRIEDGFLRSVGLGATYVPPLSVCIDTRGIYFDPTQPSDLEHILSTYDFDADPELAARASAGLARLLDSGLSKYNADTPSNVAEVYGPKDRKRVLVLGQVEGDMSILRGCDPVRNNLDIVRLAREENPDAQVIYKPHPEVIHRTRDNQTDPRDAEPYAQVVYDSIPLADSFHEVDHVYTITSLAGFEALMRRLKVTCLGAPFYSNWGLTDDRQIVSRRGRQLTLEQVFAAAYILYPRYCNPFTKEAITFEEALDLLAKMKRGEVAELTLS